MNFFEKSKALKDAATKTPWEQDKTWLVAHTAKTKTAALAYFHDYESFRGSDEVFAEKNVAYIVHCVNTHARLCELLEEAMDALDIAYTEHYRFDVKIEIQAVLDEMGKE